MKADAPAASRRRRLLAAAFLLLFLASQTLLWQAYYGAGAKALIGDEQAYHATALAILAGGSWMPSSIWPPLQPLFIAAIYAVCGVHLLAVQLVQTLLFIACAALLRDLWRQLGGSVAAANVAAALWLLNPATAAYAQWLWPEMLHLFLLLAAFCLLARPLSAARAFVAGICIGLAILAKSLLSMFWPFLLLAFVRFERPRASLRPALVFVLGLALVTTPALLHGWREYGKPMIADSSIYNLWIGLTDDARSDYVADMGGVTLPAFLASGTTPQQRNAVYLDKVRELVHQRGIVALTQERISRQYFRLFSAKTSLSSQLPGPVCAGHLSAYRSAPWLTATLTLAGDASHALLLLAAAFGIACWRRRPDRMLLIVALFFAYQLALFALIHVKARFLLPMLPFLCGFAGSFLVAWRRRSAAVVDGTIVPEPASATQRLTPVRLATGALLAALLLFLAFAGPALDHLCAG